MRIYFNVLEARDELLKKGIVFTLRSKVRAIGPANAITGNVHKSRHLCRVKVERVCNIKVAGDLLPYLIYSGFDNVDNWLAAAASGSKTLYRVTKIPEQEILLQERFGGKQ